MVLPIPEKPVLLSEVACMFSVLFVCTANICRSPMAMGLLQVMLSSGSDQWHIEPAGVRALAGYPAAANSLAVVKQRGGDISQHSSRVITRELMAEYKVILVMERGHKEALQAAFPRYAGKVFLLSELIGQSTDIADPIGGPLVEFEETAKEIDDILHQGMDQLRRYAAESPAPEE
jgi:protein-tyrosine-phosphatase